MPLALIYKDSYTIPVLFRVRAVSLDSHELEVGEK
jgi:hypothetical protein